MDTPMGDTENKPLQIFGLNSNTRFSEDNFGSEAEVKLFGFQNIFSTNWAHETKLNLSILGENLGHGYAVLLREFSALGPMSETAQNWKRLMSVSLIKDKLETALAETEIVSELCAYIEQTECEKTRFQLERQRLTEENKWLGEMKQLLRERLRKIKVKLGQVEAEREAWRFMYKMRYAGQDPQPPRIKPAPSVLEDMNIETFLSSKTRSIYNLVTNHTIEGRLDVAAAVCTQMLRDQTRKNELDEMEHAVINFLLGIVLYQKGRLREALTSMEDALETFESKLEHTHPIMGSILKQLAAGHLEMGDLTSTEEYLRRAIKSRQATLGEHHDETIKLERELCEVLIQSEQYDEAIELCASILSNVQSLHPVHEPMVIDARMLLAKVQIKGKQTDKALAQVKEILRECLLKGNLSTIADTLERDEDDAGQEYEELFAVGKESYNPQEVELLNLLREIYSAQGKGKAARHIENILSSYS